MDPTAYDRWWKARVHKETNSDPDQHHARQPISKRLTALGVPAVPSRLAPGARSAPQSPRMQVDSPQLFGKHNSQPRLSHETLLAKGPISKRVADYLKNQNGKMVPKPFQARLWQQGLAKLDGVRSDDDEVMSNASFAPAPTRVSYPSTPNHSQSTAVDSEILRRLDALELSLQEERNRRKNAEMQMLEILQTNPSSARRQHHKRNPSNLS